MTKLVPETPDLPFPKSHVFSKAEAEALEKSIVLKCESFLSGIAWAQMARIFPTAEMKENGVKSIDGIIMKLRLNHFLELSDSMDWALGLKKMGKNGQTLER